VPARAAHQRRPVIVSPVRALMQKVVPPSRLKELTLPLRVGEEVDRDPLIEFLSKGSYTPVKVVEERGDFSVRGPSSIFSPPSMRNPCGSSSTGIDWSRSDVLTWTRNAPWGTGEWTGSFSSLPPTSSPATRKAPQPLFSIT